MGSSIGAAPAPVTSPSPSEVLDRDDPGDAVQRDFRYQHAYGVILLVAAALRQHPYVAIWCEHHEDLLAERADGKWDGYQVKTRQREQGDWTLGDAELQSAIKHLVRLDLRFPGRIELLRCVSNARFSNSKAKKKVQRSPLPFLNAVKPAASIDTVPEPFGEALSELANKTGHTLPNLFAAVKRMEFVAGPQRETFDAELVAMHLPCLPACSRMTSPELRQLRDELVAAVFRASSLPNDDPSRHWCAISGDDRRHPDLAGKRITLDDMKNIVADAAAHRAPPFRYLPTSSVLAPGQASQQLDPLREKLMRAGLQSHVDSLRDRMLATERRLLELAGSDPDQIKPLLAQLEGVVRAEYSEALLPLEGLTPPYGRALLQNVYERLGDIASNRPELVDHQPYESLVGIAAMLTAECSLWWGPRFPVGGAS